MLLERKQQITEQVTDKLPSDLPQSLKNSAEAAMTDNQYEPLPPLRPLSLSPPSVIVFFTVESPLPLLLTSSRLIQLFSQHTAMPVIIS